MMIRTPMRRWALIAALLLGTVPTAWAGRGCDSTRLMPQQITQGMNLAERTQQRLDASGARVVLLARAGQDLSSYHLRWSHLGFAYRDDSGLRPVWRVLHKLNECGTANGAVYRQGLGEFFLDQPHRYEAAFVPLKPALQAELLPLLRGQSQAALLHEPRYSMVAYVWGQRYQQSNQWALETLASVAGPVVSSRIGAQQWLRSQGYRPSDLSVPALTRLAANIGKANVAFDDHPWGQRLAGHIETVTVDSIFAWLPRSGWGQNLELIVP